MMTGVALMIHGPSHDFGGAWEFVVAVLVIIVAIFLRVYGPWGRSGGPTGHRSLRRNSRGSTQRTAHSASHAPAPARNDGRRSSSKRRTHRP